MKIMSKKQYEKLQQCMVELQLDLDEERKDNLTYKAQVEALLKARKELEEASIRISNDLYESNKEIKRLKTLLTKNGIKYKKEDKNGKRN